MQIFTLVLVLHIVCGTLALGSFLIPFLARWGGTVHRRAGWVFAAAMAGVSLSAWALSVLRLVDGAPANDGDAVFLAHIGLLSGASVWSGIRIAQLKRAHLRRRPFDLAFPGLLVVSSVALFSFGIARADVLWIVFSVIGLLSGARPLRYFLLETHGPHAWMVEHLSAMGTAAISAVTAFFVVNLETLGLVSGALFFWIAPGAIGGTILSLIGRRVDERGLARKQGTGPLHHRPVVVRSVHPSR